MAVIRQRQRDAGKAPVRRGQIHPGQGAIQFQRQKGRPRRDGAAQGLIRGSLQKGRQQYPGYLLRVLALLFLQMDDLRAQRIAPGNTGEICFPEKQFIIPFAPLGGHSRIGTAGAQQHQSAQQQRKETSHTASPPFAAGQRTVNTDPPSGRLAASTVPPRRFTVSLTMERPNPVPPAARERALSTR